MEGWEGLIYGLAAALALLPPAYARAASVTGHASTVVEWFKDGQANTVVPLFQYLQLDALNLGNKGYDFHFYGRAGVDLADESQSSADSRLYLAYLDKKGFLAQNLDMRLGRQFVTTAAGASLMDGLRLDYNLLDNYRLTLYGGGDVAYYEGYNLKDADWGGQITGRFLQDQLHVGLSYLSKWDQGLLAQELFGFNANYDWHDVLSFYNETQFDYLSNRVSYLLAGAKYHPAARWTARLEYLYSLPVFSSTSIYSVFAVDEYQQALGELDYSFRPGWQAFFRYTREIYQELDDANVFEAGVEKLRTGRFAGYLSGVFRDDDQDLKGFKTHASYKFTRRLEAGLGLELDVLARRIDYFNLDDEPNDTTSGRLWADMTLYLTPKITVQAKVERIKSDLWDYYDDGRVVLNYYF